MVLCLCISTSGDGEVKERRCRTERDSLAKHCTTECNTSASIFALIMDSPTIGRNEVSEKHVECLFIDFQGELTESAHIKFHFASDSALLLLWSRLSHVIKSKFK